MQLDDGAECHVLNELDLFVNVPTAIPNVKKIGAFQSLPIVMNKRGTTYIFGKAFYDANARNILSKPLLQIQGFKTISRCEDPRYPELVTSTLVISKFGTSTVFKIEGVGKGLVLLAPIQDVIMLHTNPNPIVAPIVHSIGGARAGTRSSSRETHGGHLSGSTSNNLAQVAGLEISTTSIGSTVDILNPVNLRQKDFQGDQNVHKISDISIGDLNPSLNPSGKTGNTVSQVAGLKSSTTKIGSTEHIITSGDLRQKDYQGSENSSSVKSVFKSLGNVTTDNDKPIKPFFVPSCGRCLTKSEISKYLRVQGLHDIAHMGKERMVRLVKGGHLLNCELTSQDVEIYFEIRPACLPCLTNMQMPASLPHIIPTGTLIGTWWEIDVMMWRSYQYLICVEGITGALFSAHVTTTSRKSMAAGIAEFLKHLKQNFMNVSGIDKSITVVLDHQASFVEFEIMQQFTVEKSGVDGHSNRAEAAIKKVEYFIRAKSEEIYIKYKYRLPRCLDPDLIDFCCMVLNFTPWRKDSIDSPNVMNSVNLKMTLDNMLNLQFGQMCEVIIPIANRKGSKDLSRCEKAVKIGVELRTHTNGLFFLPVKGVRISRVKSVHTLENDELVAIMNQLESQNLTRIMKASNSSEAIREDFQEMTDTFEDEAIVVSAIYRHTNVIDRSNMTGKQASSIYEGEVLDASMGKEWNNLYQVNNCLDLSMVKLPHAPSLKDIHREKKADLAVTEVKSRFVYPGHLIPDNPTMKTVAPTVVKEALFLVLAQNQANKGEIYSYDVPSAFLNAPLDEDVNLKIPKHMVDRLVRLFPNLKQYVQDDGCIYSKVLRSLYGLKQSPRNWYLFFCNILSVEMGFTKATIEGCTFYHTDNTTKKKTFAQFHVDDTIMVSGDKVFAASVMKKMHQLFGGEKEWKTKEFDFLQMHITRQEDYSITIDNAAYVMDIVSRRFSQEMTAEFAKNRGAITPSNLELFTEVEEDNLVITEQNITDYKGVIGELLHAVVVRIDILKEVTFLAKEMCKART